jgi:hypothetical protein
MGYLSMVNPYAASYAPEMANVSVLAHVNGAVLEMFPATTEDPLTLW